MNVKVNIKRRACGEELSHVVHSRRDRWWAPSVRKRVRFPSAEAMERDESIAKEGIRMSSRTERSAQDCQSRGLIL